MFLDGKELVDFEPLYGKLKTAYKVTNVNIIVTSIKEDRHQSVRALATELKISQESICWILTGGLGMKWVYSTLVLHFLQMNIIQARFLACFKNLTMITSDGRLIFFIID